MEWRRGKRYVQNGKIMNGLSKSSAQDVSADGGDYMGRLTMIFLAAEILLNGVFAER